MWHRLKQKLASRVNRLPDGIRIYAVGDIHGRADLLSSLFETIDRDLSDRPVPRALHVFLGDYVDRGPHSLQVVASILARRERHEVVALKGNHDIFPLLFLRDPASFADWRLLGGAQTLISYGLRPALGMERTELGQLSAEFSEALPAAHTDFFSGLSPSFSCGTISLSRRRQAGIPWINRRRRPALDQTRISGS